MSKKQTKKKQIQKRHYEVVLSYRYYIEAESKEHAKGLAMDLFNDEDDDSDPHICTINSMTKKEWDELPMPGWLQHSPYTNEE